MQRDRGEDTGYCTIGVSEGLRWPDGKFLSETGLRDAFGHAQLGGVAPLIAQLVQDKLKQKYHWAVADYLQRAARHIASKTDVAQSYAVGKAAVELAVKGRSGVMPVIVRKSNKPYRWIDRRGRPEGRRQRREDDAARFHHRRTASTSPPSAASTWRRW